METVIPNDLHQDVSQTYGQTQRVVLILTQAPGWMKLIKLALYVIAEKENKLLCYCFTAEVKVKLILIHGFQCLQKKLPKKSKWRILVQILPILNDIFFIVFLQVTSKLYNLSMLFINYKQCPFCEFL